MATLIRVIDLLIELFVIALLIAMIISWLQTLNVLDPNIKLVATVRDFLAKFTEPAVAPIRRELPDLGLDISYLVVMIIMNFVRNILQNLARTF